MSPQKDSSGCEAAPRFSNHFFPFLIVVLLVGMFGSALAYGQAGYSTATLQGTVSDPSGAVIPNATVTATNAATNLAKTTKTAANGAYQLPALNPGTYQIEVDAQDFSKAVAKDVVLTVGQTFVYDVHLVVGAVGTSVNVTTEVPLIETEQAQQANTVNQRQVEHLPNISRRFTEAIYTVPGVASSNAPVVQDQNIGTGYLASGFSVGGSNGRNNLLTIDGGENDYGSGSPRTRNIPIDSLQEFQVNRNGFAAEFGNTVGTAINVVTKSGGNTFHGSGYLYFHNEGLDSVNYYTQLISPNTKPFEQSVIPGMTFGGPIKKDKLFFFSSYEHQKLDFATSQNLAGQAEFQPITAQTNGFNPATGACAGAPQQVSQLCYLTQMATVGGPFAGLGAGLLASPIFGPPLKDPILNALVAPNDGTFDGVISYLGAERGNPGFNTPRGRYNNWVTRVDYQPSQRDSLMFRFSLMNESDSVAPQPPSSTYDHGTDYTLTSNWTHTFSPTLVNVVRGQVVPANTYHNDSPQYGRAEIDLLASSSIVLGTPFPFPYLAKLKRFQFDDSLSWTKGNHSFKFGGSYRPDHYNIDEQLWYGGQFQFADGAISILNVVAGGEAAGLFPKGTAAGLEAYNQAFGYPATGPASTNLTAAQSFIAGTPIALLMANPNSNSRWTAWDNYLGFYAQDSWKISPKLTLNYGARLDYDGAPSPVPHSTRISPRVGFAWDPAGDGKTVVRAGGGVFVAPVSFLVPFYVNTLGDTGKYINQGALSAGLPSPPFPSIFAAWALEQQNATVANPNPALTAAQIAALGWAINPPGPTAFGSVFSTIAPNFKPEYTIQASLSVARQLARELSLEVGYNLYRSVHVEQTVEGNFQRAPCNAVFPGVYSSAIDPFVGPCYAARPGTTAGVLNALVFQNSVWSSSGNGIYNALTASLTKRFSHGLQFQANYTYSRAIDNTSDYSTLSTPFRPDQLSQDRSVSSFNVTHNFVANAVYATPSHVGGDFLSKVLRDITISPILYARSGIPFTLLVPGLGGLSGNGTIGRTSEARPWYEPRNSGRGPDFVSCDLRFSKAFSLNQEKGVKLNVIAQAQNLFNRVNFAAVNNIFPANPNLVLPNGGTLLAGPFNNIGGFAPTTVSQLSQPLAFSSAYPPRYVSFGLQLTF